MLLVSSLAWPAWAAQSQQAASGPVFALNEQQRLGRILFMQNCAICHLPYKGEDKSGQESATVGPVLKSLFRREKPLSEQTVRTLILRGVSKKMPAFQYGLDTKEIDQIVEYLKTL